MPTEVIFKDLIYRDTLHEFKNDNDKFYHKALEIKNQSSMNSKWNCDTFNTYNLFDLSKDDLFVPLIQKCQTKVEEFALEHGVTKKSKYINSWINIASEGNFQEFHRHERCNFSLVYYVKAPKNCGNLIFKKDSYDDMFRLPFDDTFNNSNKVAGFTNYYIVPNECDIVIFKSNILHMVEKNKSKDDRVSIAMNFYYDYD